MHKYKVTAKYGGDSITYTVDAESESAAIVEARKDSYEIFGLNPQANYGLWSPLGYRPSVDIVRYEEKTITWPERTGG